MRSALSHIVAICAFATAATAQDHGSFSYKGQTVALTSYRTRVKDNKRWVIADGKMDGKLYSITVTLQPDVTTPGTVATDKKHSVTLTVSNADYSHAQNYCFDAGSSMDVAPQDGKYTIFGRDMQPGNCFGGHGMGSKLSFAVKP